MSKITSNEDKSLRELSDKLDSILELCARDSISIEEPVVVND